MLVHQFLERSASAYPDKPAVWHKNSWLTYRELNRRANQIANSLFENGVGRGDRVALLWENSFEYVAAYYGILKAGAVTVAINTEIVAEDLAYLLNDSEAVALIAHKKYRATIQQIADSLDWLKLVVSDAEVDVSGPIETILPLEVILSNDNVESPAVRVIDPDLASIIYTSGSTGKPKGVMLSHLNIVTNTRSIIEYLSLDSKDRVMVILPFFYVYGKSLLNTHVAAGASLVLDNRFTFPNAVLKTMAQTECTGFSGVPSTFSILLNKSSVQKMVFPKLRYLTQAGGPMAPALQKEVAMTFYPANLFIMYGATEASARLSYLDPRQLTRKWGSIGQAIPNVDVFVADQEGLPVAQGETGEIVARGSNIMQGYWKDEEETQKVLRNGLYFTGDLGKMDDEGYIYVVGRSKDMIKAGANRVSAKEIEEKILEHGDLHEVAVIGVEDPTLGEAIKAFVVPKPGIVDFTEEKLITFCKKVLPAFKVPRHVEIKDSLPKNASGKISKLELKKNQGELTR